MKTPQVYSDILIAAGYVKHNPVINNTQCWIRMNYPDINVDLTSGLWASESDDCGKSQLSLEGYLANVKPHMAID